MFCSNCGKTVSAEWKKCKHCNAPIGESHFDGVPYTSAQARIQPGQSTYRDALEARQYTRASYTGDYDDQNAGDVDVRTTYRPVYEGASVPADMREDIRAVVGADDERQQEETKYVPPKPIDEDELERNIEGFDISQIKSRPIVAKKRAGLSSDVEEFVRRLETGDDGEKPTRRGRHLAANDPYNEENTPDAEPEEEDLDDEPSGFDTRRIIKIVAALVVVAALFVAGIYVVPGLISKFKKVAAAPIEGVTVEMYDSAVALLQQHVQDSYKTDVLSTYTAGGYVGLITRLDADKAAMQALLPAAPGVNDELFMQAITAIQDDIGNALTLDAVEIANSGAATSAESAARWATINDMVSGFTLINSATGLSAIVAGDRIIADLTTATPEPQFSPEPQYTTLSKGDDSKDVQAMQERLWELGYLDDARDGKFGSNTQTAVKSFQQAAGIEVTGVANNDTLVLLFSEDAPMTADAKITPAPDITEEPTAEPAPAPES